MNVLYLRNVLKSPTKLYVADVKPENEKIDIVVYPSGYDFMGIKDFFTDIDKVIIYSAIVQEDGRETDEMVHMYFDQFTKLTNVTYNLDSDTYTVTLVEPDVVDQRLTALEKKSEELPPLTSPFTTNLEPTGVAKQYYEKDELIAIYNNGLPVTVKATIPISYKQPIIIDLNCELYLGGN